MSAAPGDPGTLRYMAEADALMLNLADFSLRQTSPLLTRVGGEVEKQITALQKYRH